MALGSIGRFQPTQVSRSSTRSSANAPAAPQLTEGPPAAARDSFEPGNNLRMGNVIANTSVNLNVNVNIHLNVVAGGVPASSNTQAARGSAFDKVKELFEAAKQGKKFGKEDMQRFQDALKAHAQSLPEGSAERAEFEKAGNAFSQALHSGQGKADAANTTFTHALADDVWKQFLASQQQQLQQQQQQQQNQPQPQQLRDLLGRQGEPLVVRA